MPDPVAAPPTAAPPAAPASAPAAAPAGVDLAQLRAQVQAEELPRIRAAAEAELRAAFAKEMGGVQARYAEDLALSDAGVRDDIGRQTIRANWERVPKAERGEGGPAEWWSRTVAAHKAHAADPKQPKPNVHPTLTAYLPTVEAPAAPPAAPRFGRAPVSVDGGTMPANGMQIPTPKPGVSVHEWMSSLGGLGPITINGARP